MRRFFGPATAAIFAGLFVAPAQAEFGNCSDPAWIGSVRPELAGLSYDCVEALRVPVATADGERWIRIVHDREAGWILDAAILAEVERGLRGAVDAMARLGAFRLDDVTLLLADDLPPGVEVDGRAPEEGEILAETSFLGDEECIVAFYLLGRGVRPEFTATTVAHEIFHCLQKATLDPALMASGSGGLGGGGDWWIEGSAEWFTALALPDLGPLGERAAGFDSYSPGTALNDLAYEAAIFFLWLGGAEGPGRVLPFLSRMAPDRSSSAQWAALAGALAPERWSAYAQDYRDANVHHPHGTALPISPQPGETWTIDRTRTLSGPATPFLLLRGTAELACGRWRLSSAQPAIQVSRRQAEGGAWNSFEGELMVEEGETLRLNIVMINTSAGRRPLSVRFERLATCQPCAGSRETDACLVGAWRQTGGGAIEWLRANLPPEITLPYAEQSEAVFVLLADGSYVALPVDLAATFHLHRPDGIERALGSGSAEGAGRWSIVGGQLALCQDSGGLLGSMTLTTAEDEVEVPVAVAGAASLVMSYACDAGSLSTSLTLASDLPPMVTTYERITE